MRNRRTVLRALRGASRWHAKAALIIAEVNGIDAGLRYAAELREKQVGGQDMQSFQAFLEES